MLIEFDYQGRSISLTCPDDADPEQVKRDYILSIDPSYRWLLFRRALLESPIYPLSVSLAIAHPALAIADGKLTSALDMCCVGGAEPPEVEAFQSAIALYLSTLPTNADGDLVRESLIALAINNLIPLPQP